MPAGFDTSALRPGERFDYWRDVVCKHFVTAGCADRSSGPFDAQLALSDLGPFMIGALKAPRHVWTREPRDIRVAPDDDILMGYLVNGEGRLTQGGRTVRQRAGDVVLYDARLPFTYELDAAAIVMKLPRDMLAARARVSEALCARAIGAGNPLRPLLGHLLTQCVDPASPCLRSPTAGARLGACAFNMLLALTDIEIEDGDPLAPAQLVQLERGKRYAIAHLGDQALGSERMADHAGVSLRTLNRLFARIGTTPMRWVWQQRLEASHHEIAAGLAQNVTDAAFRFGFKELSHFSRSFKAAYGVTPQSILAKRAKPTH
jgi:AraC-like DNA-binding protein